MEKFLYGTSNVTVDDETSVKDAVVVEKEITSNGTYIASNEPKVDGKTVDGYSKVEVDVQPNLQVGTGTVNGETYYPSTGYDGFSEFTVEIPADTNVTHEIHYTADKTDVYFTIINQDKTNYSDFDSLFTALWDKGARSASTALNASGTSQNDTITKVYARSPQRWIIFQGSSTNFDLDNVVITDNVISGSANLLGQKNITQNGLYGAESEGYDGYRSVYVNVPMSRTPRLQSKTAQASSSQQVITFDTGYDGLQQVTISAVSGTYSISSNGEYDIAQYGKVSVNVETANIGAITEPLHENRTYTATDYGLSGISSFKVDVQLLLQDKTVTITQNNTTETITKDSGYNGLGTVTVNVNVPKDMKLKKLVENTLTEINASDIDGATTIQPKTFVERDFLTKVEIPETVTSIKNLAFDGCIDLTDVDITVGANNIIIYSEAFSYCRPLTNIKIDCRKGKATLRNNSFIRYGSSSKCVVTILDGDKDPMAVFQGEPFPGKGDINKLEIRVSSTWLSTYRNLYPAYYDNFVVNDNE